LICLLAAGCVPATIVQWTVRVERPNEDSQRKDLRSIAEAIVGLGYSRQSANASEGYEFYAYMAHRPITVALLADKNGDIRVKFVEHGEKELSPIGQQQVSLIADALRRRFSLERIDGPAPSD
jgi:hypothetical protein